MRIRILLVAFLLLNGSAAAQPPREAPKKMEQLIAEARRRMNDLVDTKEFQEKIAFAKFLQMLEKQMSKEKPFAIQLDREAFGKDADKILKAEVSLPPVPTRMVASIALRLALAQASVEGQEIEFTARPGGLVFTTRDRSLYTATYEIGDLLKHTRELHESIPKDGKILGAFFLIGPDAPGYDLKADPAKPDEWIVRQLVALTDGERAGWHKRTPASTMRVVNGSKLIVHTAPSVHDEINQILSSFRRLVDVAVIMNARVYAFDRAEYDAHFAASFVDPKEKSARLTAPLTDVQLQKLQTRKPLLESDAVKLRPSNRELFLSHQNVYQYQARPGEANLATAFEGFSFAVRPSLSADRRCLRLELSHEVEQLVKLTKGSMVDLKTGKELPIELPNLRKSALSGTIEIHDGQSIMLAVDYRPTDRVWLVVAQPRIYMEEEEERLRRGDITPIEPEPAKLPPVALPNTSKMKQLLQALVSQVMTDKELKQYRDFIGTPGETKFVLVDGDVLAWPKSFRPEVPEWQWRPFDPNECRSFKPRIVGIYLENYTRTDKVPKGWEVVVEVVLANAGGIANGGLGFKSSCPVYCRAKRIGARWVVECEPHPFGAEVIP